MPQEHLDCIIVGAGLSGVGMAYQLQQRCPTKTFAILEGRGAIGGTWDLFRYPGIRSDSSMTTLGYSFRPWVGQKSIAGGEEIRSYIRDTATIHGIDKKICFQHRVKHADFSSDTGRWTLTVTMPDGERTLTCGMLLMCAGYYRYEAGYTPEFAGRSDFKGEVIHPQHWPEHFDAAGKRIVVIGSGATAVSLIPSLAEKAAHVTMLQRSPSYVVPWPDVDPFANTMRKHLPLKAAGPISRWKASMQGLYFYTRTRKAPDKVRATLLDLARQASGSAETVEKHFSPRYNPWDQRMCLDPNGAIFKSLREGKASVVTDEIDRFVAGGIKTKSGHVIEADVIVTATGLVLQSMGGASMTVDGRRVEPGKLVGYKGVMYGGVPNLINTMGYVNASWTLKSDLTARFACRLIAAMDQKGTKIAVPAEPPADMELLPWSALSSGYFARAQNITPKQGTRGPWRAPPNYLRDYMSLRFGKMDDGVLTFAQPSPRATRAPLAEAAE